jgi:hypothetical protein
VLDALGRDQPVEALAAADAALIGVPDAHFTSQHFGHLVAVVRVFLYTGDGARAWAMIERAWPGLEESGFLALEGIGVVLQYLRGCAALAAADAVPAQSGAVPTLLRHAERAARRLRRVSLPTGAPLACAVEAGVQARRGNQAKRVSALARAIEGFDRVEMALHRESARLLLGLLDGREPEVRRARAWMVEEAVQDAVALARATVPGPFPVPRDQEARPSLA